VGIKTKLEKLERRAGQHYTTLHLPDGTQVRYTPDEEVKAFAAAVGGREHWLTPHFRRAGKTTGLPGLVWALEASRERIEREGGKDGS